MSDLIERQAAIEAIFGEPLYESGMKKRDADAVVPAIYEKIKSLSPAQPEIIHCKDCEHFGVDRHKKLTWCSRNGYGYQADDFCSKAERRTNDRSN